jgi:hypothetical protein
MKTAPVIFGFREPPETVFRSWVEGGGSSVFGVAGFMAAAWVGLFLTVNLPGLMGCRSLLVIIFAFQAARVNDFNAAARANASKSIEKQRKR